MSFDPEAEATRFRIVEQQIIEHYGFDSLLPDYVRSSINQNKRWSTVEFSLHLKETILKLLQRYNDFRPENAVRLQSLPEHIRETYERTGLSLPFEDYLTQITIDSDPSPTTQKARFRLRDHNQE